MLDRHSGAARFAIIGPLAVLLISVLAVPSQAAVTADDIVKASSTTRADVVRDLNQPDPARCYRVGVVTGARDWVVIDSALDAYKHPNVCPNAFDGWWVAHRIDGTWYETDILGPTMDCRTMAKVLKREHAPKPVVHVFSRECLS